MSYPNNGDYTGTFGKEQLYQMYLPTSANADLEAAAAGLRAPSAGKYVYDEATGRYIWVPATASPAPTLSKVLNQNNASPGLRGPGYQNTGWNSLSNSDKAAFYANEPGYAAITQAGQSLFGNTLLGLAAAKLNPENTEQSKMIAMGINPDATGTINSGNNVRDPAQAAQAAQAQAQAPSLSQTQANVLGAIAREAAANNSSGDGSGAGPAGPGASGTGGGGAHLGGDKGDGSGNGESRGGLNLHSQYFPHMAQGGISAFAPGGMGDLGGYSDGGRLLRGPGDGVSDSIPANIGGKRPARLADGEFVVPARIVSELGNGSTEAGARKLYAMLDRIQAGRKKSIGKGKVATDSRMDKNLPA